MARVHKKMIKNIIKAEMKKKKAPKKDIDEVIDTLDKIDLKTLTSLFANPATAAEFLKDPSKLNEYVKEDSEPQSDERNDLSEDTVAEIGMEENPGAQV